MTNYKKISLLFIAMVLQLCLFAQQNLTTVTDNNTGLMRSEGKIYVAMTVAITILAGLIIFVWRLDKKITSLEKK